MLVLILARKKLPAYLTEAGSGGSTAANAPGGGGGRGASQATPGGGGQATLGGSSGTP